MNYKRFNRHQLFTAEDLQNVREAINNVIDNGESYGSLHNSLCGLYDGYFYDDVDVEAYQTLDFKVFCNLAKTLKKIEGYFVTEQESIVTLER